MFLFSNTTRPPLGHTLSPVRWITVALHLIGEERGMQLNAHLHLVQMLTMHGASPPHLSGVHRQNRAIFEVLRASDVAEV
jgi:hypothetical protein